MMETTFIERVAEEISATPIQVAKVIQLLTGGATIPFIARYRKDVTGNLDETRIEIVAERGAYFAALSQRRATILETIAKQGKLTEELREKIEGCFDKTTLEDLYLPYKQARRTRATTAIEQGLAPLADFLWMQQLLVGTPTPSIELFAETFINPEKSISSVEEAIEGARFILCERMMLDVETRAIIRERMMRDGKLQTKATKNAEKEKTKFEAYYDFNEAIATIPSHRLLAILRGVRQGFLRADIIMDDDAMQLELLGRSLKEAGSPFEPIIRQTVEEAFMRNLRPSLENEVISQARERAEEDAIRVFRDNAGQLLLASPAGQLSVIGVDPGLRTGCKLAVVDRFGAYQESATIFPTPPKEDKEGAEAALCGLLTKYDANAIAIGNGTGSREVFAFIREVLSRFERKGIFVVLVNEAGASVYSASKVAREEFPDLDVTIRGAISIARRLQDPLAELVKIDPKSIGVGQYQHDVNQKDLREGLQRTVEYCVNRVGVDINTASPALMRYVSGMSAPAAQNIVEFRSRLGGFKSRTQLLEVNGIGPRTFEQCAGFLRVVGGDNALDSTSIHPEAYPVIEQMAAALNVSVSDLIANPALLDQADLSQFATETIGALTLADIREELKKPGRDPRAEFRAPKFLDGITSVQGLQEGMTMEGVVTNVTDFGAFVDIGVHQDGLVHLSELANRYVKDPHEVVKVGQIVNVKVIAVDKDQPRISLSIKALLAAQARSGEGRPRGRRPEQTAGAEGAPAENRPPRRPRRDRPAGAPAEGAAAEGGATPARPAGARPPRREGAPRPPQAAGAPGQAPRPERSAEPRRDRKPQGAPTGASSDADGRPSRRPDRTGGEGGRRGGEGFQREGRDDRSSRPRRDDRREGGHPGRISQLKHTTGAEGTLNTLLADQLASLKDKFSK